MNPTYDPARPETLLAHADFVRRLAYRLLDDPHGADDVVQQTFTAALERPPRQQDRVRSWLATVARRFAQERRRSELHRRQRERITAAREDVPSTEEILQREQVRRRVVEALLGLEEPFRSTLVLRFFDDLPPRKIAQRLGVPVETVRSRVRRGLERMRGHLDDSTEGGRRQWVMWLAPIASPPAGIPFGLGPILGVMAMSTELKLASVAAIVVAAWLGTWWWNGVDDTHPLGAQAGADRVDAIRVPALDAPEPRATSSTPLREVAAPSEGATTPQGEAAAVDPSRGDVKVTVTWARDGTPAAGIGLEVAPSGATESWHARRFGATDGEGVAHFRRIEPGRAVVYLQRLGADGSFSAELIDIQAGQIEAVEFQVAEDLEIAGRVLDDNDQPVTGAEIWLSSGASASEGQVVTVSDADGRFRLRTVSMTQLVAARAEGFAPSRAASLIPLAIEAQNERSTEPLSLTLHLLRGGGAVRGVVLGPDSQPLEDALVILGRRNGWIDNEADPPPQRFRTGARGEFHFDSVATGTLPIWARAPGFAPFTAELEVFDAATTQVQAVLGPGVTLLGRIVDEDGAGIPGAALAIDTREGFDRAQVLTDANGEFRYDHAPIGELDLEASATGYPPVSHHVVAVGGEVVTWRAQLLRGLTIHGHLRDQQGGPLASWVIHCVPRDPEEEARFAYTDSNGAFTVPHLKEGEHRLEVTPPRGWMDLPVVVVPSVTAGPEALELRVKDADRPSAYLVGHIKGPQGEAVTGAYLVLLHEGRETHYSIPGRIEKDGAFRYGPLPPAEYLLRAGGDGYQERSLGTRRLYPDQILDLGEVRLLEPERP